DWLVRRIWPLEAAHTEETVYWSALLGAAELLLGGTTAILDMETVRHTGAAFQALERIGIRAAVGKCLMDAHPEGAPLELAESTDNALAEAEALAQRWHSGGGAGGRLPRGDRRRRRPMQQPAGRVRGDAPRRLDPEAAARRRRAPRRPGARARHARRRSRAGTRSRARLDRARQARRSGRTRPARAAPPPRHGRFGVAGGVR